MTDIDEFFDIDTTNKLYRKIAPDVLKRKQYVFFDSDHSLQIAGNSISWIYDAVNIRPYTVNSNIPLQNISSMKIYKMLFNNFFRPTMDTLYIGIRELAAQSFIIEEKRIHFVMSSKEIMSPLNNAYLTTADQKHNNWGEFTFNTPMILNNSLTLDFYYSSASNTQGIQPYNIILESKADVVITVYPTTFLIEINTEYPIPINNILGGYMQINNITLYMTGFTTTDPVADAEFIAFMNRKEGHSDLELVPNPNKIYLNTAQAAPALIGTVVNTNVKISFTFNRIFAAIEFTYLKDNPGYYVDDIYNPGGASVNTNNNAVFSRRVPENVTIGEFKERGALVKRFLNRNIAQIAREIEPVKLQKIFIVLDTKNTNLIPLQSRELSWYFTYDGLVRYGVTTTNRKVYNIVGMRMYGLRLEGLFFYFRDRIQNIYKNYRENPWPLFTVSIREFEDQSFITQENRKFHFMGDILESFGIIEIQPEKYNNGYYWFYKPIKEITSLTVSLGAPVENIFWPAPTDFGDSTLPIVDPTIPQFYRFLTFLNTFDVFYNIGDNIVFQRRLADQPPDTEFFRRFFRAEGYRVTNIESAGFGFYITVDLFGLIPNLFYLFATVNLSKRVSMQLEFYFVDNEFIDE